MAMRAPLVVCRAAVLRRLLLSPCDALRALGGAGRCERRAGRRQTLVRALASSQAACRGHARAPRGDAARCLLVQDAAWSKQARAAWSGRLPLAHIVPFSLTPAPCDSRKRRYFLQTRREWVCRGAVQGTPVRCVFCLRNKSDGLRICAQALLREDAARGLDAATSSSRSRSKTMALDGGDAQRLTRQLEARREEELAARAEEEAVARSRAAVATAPRPQPRAAPRAVPQAVPRAVAKERDAAGMITGVATSPPIAREPLVPPQVLPQVLPALQLPAAVPQLMALKAELSTHIAGEAELRQVNLALSERLHEAERLRGEAVNSAERELRELERALAEQSAARAAAERRVTLRQGPGISAEAAAAAELTRADLDETKAALEEARLAADAARMEERAKAARAVQQSEARAAAATENAAYHQEAAAAANEAVAGAKRAVVEAEEEAATQRRDAALKTRQVAEATGRLRELEATAARVVELERAETARAAEEARSAMARALGDRALRRRALARFREGAAWSARESEVRVICSVRPWCHSAAFGLDILPMLPKARWFGNFGATRAKTARRFLADDIFRDRSAQCEAVASTFAHRKLRFRAMALLREAVCRERSVRWLTKRHNERAGRGALKAWRVLQAAWGRALHARTARALARWRAGVAEALAERERFSAAVAMARARRLGRSLARWEAETRSMRLPPVREAGLTALADEHARRARARSVTCSWRQWLDAPGGPRLALAGMRAMRSRRDWERTSVSFSVWQLAVAEARRLDKTLHAGLARLATRLLTRQVRAWQEAAFLRRQRREAAAHIARRQANALRDATMTAWQAALTAKRVDARQCARAEGFLWRKRGRWVLAEWRAHCAAQVWSRERWATAGYTASRLCRARAMRAWREVTARRVQARRVRAEADAAIKRLALGRLVAAAVSARVWRARCAAADVRLHRLQLALRRRCWGAWCRMVASAARAERLVAARERRWADSIFSGALRSWALAARRRRDAAAAAVAAELDEASSVYRKQAEELALENVGLVDRLHEVTSALAEAHTQLGEARDRGAQLEVAVAEGLRREGELKAELGSGAAVRDALEESLRSAQETARQSEEATAAMAAEARSLRAGVGARETALSECEAALTQTADDLEGMGDEYEGKLSSMAEIASGLRGLVAEKSTALDALEVERKNLESRADEEERRHRSDCGAMAKMLDQAEARRAEAEARAEHWEQAALHAREAADTTAGMVAEWKGRADDALGRMATLESEFRAREVKQAVAATVRQPFLVPDVAATPASALAVAPTPMMATASMAAIAPVTAPRVTIANPAVRPPPLPTHATPAHAHAQPPAAAAVAPALRAPPPLPSRVRDDTTTPGAQAAGEQCSTPPPSRRSEAPVAVSLVKARHARERFDDLSIEIDQLQAQILEHLRTPARRIAKAA